MLCGVDALHELARIVDVDGQVHFCTFVIHFTGSRGLDFFAVEHEFRGIVVQEQHALRVLHAHIDAHRADGRQGVLHQRQACDQVTDTAVAVAFLVVAEIGDQADVTGAEASEEAAVVAAEASVAGIAFSTVKKSGTIYFYEDLCDVSLAYSTILLTFAA